MLIALVSQSKILAGKDAELSLMAQACSYQLQKHVGPAWESGRVSSVMYYADPKQVPASAFPITLLDDPDDPGALGYHTEGSDGKVWGRVFVKPVMDNGGVILSGKLSIASVLSHEAIELWADPQCNRWADGPGGKSFSFELGDPVESDSYTVTIAGHPVSVSNFALPAWFDPSPPPGSAFDYLHKLHAPFTMTPGGYVVYRKDGAEHQAFGEQYPSWRKGLKQIAGARGERRARARLPLPRLALLPCACAVVAAGAPFLASVLGISNAG